MSLILWMMSYYPAQSTSGHIVRFFIALLAAIFFDYHFGLEQYERRKLSVIIRKQIARKWEEID